MAFATAAPSNNSAVINQTSKAGSARNEYDRWSRSFQASIGESRN
jgi:hypothetical protein